MKFYRQHRLKFNMFLMMIIVVLSIMSLVGVSINMAFANISKNRLQISYQQMIEERGNIMSMTIDNVFKLCDEIITNDTIYEALCNYDQLSDTDFLRIHKEIEAFIASKYYFLNSIKAINIITDDRQFLFDEGYDVSTGKYIEQIMETADVAGGKTVWSYIKDIGRKQTNYIITTRAINYRFRTERVGYLIVSISETYFKNLFSDLYLGENARIMVLDKNNDVVSTAVNDERDAIGTKLSFLPDAKDEVWEAGSFFTASSEDGTKYTVVHAKIDQTDWQLVGLVADSYLNSESNAFFKMVLLAGILAFFVIIVVFFALSNSIFKPLDALVNHMRSADPASLMPFNGSKQSGEIETLANAYNAQISQIGDLIEEIKENEKNKNEMKLQLLQAQINPHFLFNTLDSLKWVALMSRCDNVAHGINALSELLRSAISKREYVTLKEEIHNIENYITIMKIRFNEYFDVHIALPKELEDTYILKMLLQPMVENSIIHGISNLNRKGLIEISAVRSENGKDVIITVRDNGVGFNEETLAAAAKDTRQKSFHIGMDNVAERIALYFGKEYGYEIHSVPGKGTEVIFTLPFLVQEEGTSY